MTSNYEMPNSVPRNLAEALEIEPQEVATLIHAGYLYYQQGRLKEAHDLFEAAALLDRLNPYIYAILGSIYQKQKKYEESVANYTLALQLFPEDVQALTNRGEVYLNQGMLMEAVYDFEEAIRNDRSGNHPAANRARALAILTREALKIEAQDGNEASNDARSRIINQLSI